MLYKCIHLFWSWLFCSCLCKCFVHLNSIDAASNIWWADYESVKLSDAFRSRSSFRLLLRTWIPTGSICVITNTIVKCLCQCKIFMLLRLTSFHKYSATTIFLLRYEYSGPIFCRMSTGYKLYCKTNLRITKAKWSALRQFYLLTQLKLCIDNCCRWIRGSINLSITCIIHISRTIIVTASNI